MAEQDKEYLSVITSTKIEDVPGWIESYQKRAPKDQERKYTPEKFWTEWKDEKLNNNNTNLEIVWNTYDDIEKVKYKDAYDAKALPFIKPQTTVIFKGDGFERRSFPDYPNMDSVFENMDVKPYYSAQYLELVGDDKFIRSQQVLNSDFVETGMSLLTMRANCRVYLYMVSLDKVVDITPLVISLNTWKTRKTGSFSMTVAPNYKSVLMDTGGSIVEQYAQMSGGKYQTKSFLEKFVQYNDTVFIKFETLELEEWEDLQSTEEMDLVIQNNKPGELYWDMIGFVDNCQISYDGLDNITSIEITGRDMSKFFDEDGDWFLPLQTVSKALNYSYNAESTQQRNPITGEYDFLWKLDFKKMKECVWWIINVMSHVRATRGTIFDNFPDKRSSDESVPGQKTDSPKGVWQILKVYMDSELDNLTLCDRGIANPGGTMTEYMDKVCQFPFVEYFFDTYINDINLVVRRPPVTKAAIEEVFSSNTYVTIDASNIISQSLSYDDRFYSWYQIDIGNSWLGSDQGTVRTFIPIVSIPEFAEMWGMRQLRMTDIYLQVTDAHGPDAVPIISNFQLACLTDLVFLIESNMYLPFTRRGTITIVGDRRIKVGTFVKSEFSNEFFYVTGVTQNLQFSTDGIQRTTTLNVERGMYVPILEGSSLSDVNKKRTDNSNGLSGVKSYFDIVDLKPLRDMVQEVKQKKEEAKTIASWKNEIHVKQDVFDFFVQRKMFGE